MQREAKIFPREIANFSREVLDQLLHRGIISSDGEEFGLGDVDFKPRAFIKKRLRSYINAPILCCLDLQKSLRRPHTVSTLNFPLLEVSGLKRLSTRLLR